MCAFMCAFVVPSHKLQHWWSRCEHPCFVWTHLPRVPRHSERHGGIRHIGHARTEDLNELQQLRPSLPRSCVELDEQELPLCDGDSATAYEMLHMRCLVLFEYGFGWLQPTLIVQLSSDVRHF